MASATVLAPTQDSKITIDPEFQALVPPLQAEALSQLEAHIKRDGCREPLVVWEGCGVLLDGHHRLEICQREGLPYATGSLSFPDRDAARLWVVMNQFGRRNLTPFQRAELALVLTGQVKSKKQDGGSTASVDCPGPSIRRTRKRAALFYRIGRTLFRALEHAAV